MKVMLMMKTEGFLIISTLFQILDLFVSLVCQLCEAFFGRFDLKGIHLLFSAPVVLVDVKMISRGLALNMLSQGTHDE